jgi:hypothetical protein
MAARVALLRAYELRAWARALLWREWVFACEEEAFAPLWDAAGREGLLDQFGEQALEEIIDAACAAVFREEPE